MCFISEHSFRNISRVTHILTIHLKFDNSDLFNQQQNALLINIEVFFGKIKLLRLRLKKKNIYLNVSQYTIVPIAMEFIDYKSNICHTCLYYLFNILYIPVNISRVPVYQAGFFCLGGGGVQCCYSIEN